ncbi:MAG: hypothetical protein E7360_01875 [Clostridiales bacterium]|nr:hypothetical protein [Clostridiales bacterium]
MKKFIVLLLSFLMIVATASCGGNASPCAHNEYSNGKCTQCGKVCEHVYADGECTVCKKNCEHTAYVNGKCNECGKVCAHTSYEDGKCKVCKMDCVHSFKEGTCEVCGAEDPYFIPADGGESLYGELIDEFTRIIFYKYNNGTLPTRENESGYVDALYEVGEYFEPSRDMGYALKDVNGDGWKELLLMESDNRLDALFTLVDKQIVTVEVFQNGMGYLYKDGLFFYNKKRWDSNNVQIYIENHWKRLEGGKFVGQEFVKCDEDEDSTTEGDKYYAQETGKERQEITKDEYQVYSDLNYELVSWATRHTRDSELRFNSVLFPTQTDASLPFAKFGTYEEIIETFAYMTNTVAKSTSYFKRIEWSRGSYGNKMKFANETDYFTYDKIIASITRIKAPTSTTEYGYSLKDIDGDNSEELILLSDNFVILAIFTKVNEKAVLLDTYNEWNEAWIGSDGLIHVEKSVFPGYSKDRTYCVYTVENGALKSTLTLEFSYGGADKNSKWYTVENGNRREVEKAVWETAFVNWELDKGSEKSYDYTKEKSGLIFVNV